MNFDTSYLSEHFSWSEAIRTDHRNINNAIPNETVAENIIKTSVKMEKIRAILSTSIIVNSWFRCVELNSAIGGARNSDHLRGAAFDFIAPKFGAPVDICKKLIEEKSLLGFKQLILEHSWVHISWELIPGGIPKMEVLSLLENGGYAKGLTTAQGKSIA